MKPSHHPQGIIFVTAIVLLAVMMVIGTVFMVSAMQQFADARRDLHALHALAMADAGLNYVIWNQKYPTESGAAISQTAIPTAPSDLRLLSATSTPAPPFALAWDQDTDTAKMWLLKIPGITSGYQVISKGYYRGYLRSVRATVRAPVSSDSRPAIFDNALFSGADMSLGGSVIVNGKVGSNGNFSGNGSFSITGGLNAAGSISIKGSPTIGGLTEYGTTISAGGAHITPSHTGTTQPFPSLDMAAYEAYARRFGQVITPTNGTYELHGNYEFTDTNKVLYVKGNVDLSGSISGVGTIVAEGYIDITGNVSTAGHTGTQSPLVLVSTNQLRLRGNINFVDAFIYAHGIDGTQALADAGGNVTIYGAVIADSIRSNGNITIHYRPPQPPVLPPGDDPNAWNVASWEAIQ